MHYFRFLMNRWTSKYQAILPKGIRKRLQLKIGNQILYELLPDDTVIVRKTSPLDLDYLRVLNSTLNEWDSNEDTSAYKSLCSLQGHQNSRT